MKRNLFSSEYASRNFSREKYTAIIYLVTGPRVLRVFKLRKIVHMRFYHFLFTFSSNSRLLEATVQNNIFERCFELTEHEKAFYIILYRRISSTSRCLELAASSGCGTPWTLYFTTCIRTCNWCELITCHCNDGRYIVYRAFINNRICVLHLGTFLTPTLLCLYFLEN